MKQVIKSNERLLLRLQNILKKHTSEGPQNAFLRSMIGTSGETIEDKSNLLQKMLSGLGND